MLRAIIVGKIRFDGKEINVYNSVDDPWFMGTEIAKAIEYSDGNVWRLVEKVEVDEKLVCPMIIHGQKRAVTYINEMGLYNVLSQSRAPLARKWRKIIHKQLIDIRKEKEMDIVEQFNEWNDQLDDIYYDEETGMLMQSVTVPGGDVEQIPYVPKRKENNI